MKYSLASFLKRIVLKNKYYNEYENGFFMNRILYREVFVEEMGQDFYNHFKGRRFKVEKDGFIIGLVFDEYGCTIQVFRAP